MQCTPGLTSIQIANTCYHLTTPDLMAQWQKRALSPPSAVPQLTKKGEGRSTGPGFETRRKQNDNKKTKKDVLPGSYSTPGRNLFYIFLGMLIEMMHLSLDLSPHSFSILLPFGCSESILPILLFICCCEWSGRRLRRLLADGWLSSLDDTGNIDPKNLRTG